MLELIPVMDLLGGQVVHARKGERSRYLPLASSLCAGSDPETVVAALLRLHPFRTLYIADLDAIQRLGSNAAVIAAIHTRFAGLELWVDCGIADERALQDWIGAGLGLPVIGSETLSDARFVLTAQAQCRPLAPILSLDFMADTFRGPAELLSDPAAYWPPRLLAMNLARVGSDTGPDLGLIRRLLSRLPGRAVYAAGGVRSAADLQQVADAGGAGALLASALHDGRLGRTDLARFNS
jgi:phosphoribosylformimino-5-aminoimidazole carboxamide ribotide isomerase